MEQETQTLDSVPGIQDVNHENPLQGRNPDGTFTKEHPWSFQPGNQVAACKHDYPVRADTNLYRTRREWLHRRTYREDLDTIADTAIAWAKTGSIKHIEWLSDGLFGKMSYSEDDLRGFIADLARIVSEEVKDPATLERIDARFGEVLVPAGV